MRKIIPPSNQVQLDLFSPDCSPSEPVTPAETIAAHKPAAAPSVPPEEMSDECLLTEFPRASVAAVSALGAELIKRRPAGWQEAAIKLWCRFRGFGGERPMVEQEIILTMAVETADRRLLDAIMVEGQILPCFEPFLVRAAAANGAALPTEMVEAGLRNKQADVRCAALRLAVISGLGRDDIYASLTDPVREVRRAAAITLAEAGEEAARDMLLCEMLVRPSRPLLEALSFVANEDVVIRLGQLGRQKPEWCEVVIAVLDTIDHPKAGKVIASLMN